MEAFKKEDGESENAVNGNIEALKAILPDAFTENGVNFDVLRQLLGDDVADGEEKYGLSWHGKKKARQIALTPSTGTLLPCPQESVDWATTKNLFIEGDNLEVLKLLQKSYAGAVKMVYIDPPYNTDGDFIYPDRFQDNLDTYLRYTGQVGEDGIRISSNTETSGRKHTNWLSMMLPRLKLARTLLSDSGLLLCHIDEHEVSNLHHLLDELFGAENNLGPIVWDKRNPKGDATGIATQHEYIVIYAKNAEKLKEEHPIKRPKKNAERMINKATSLFAKIGKSTTPDDLKNIVRKYNLPVDLSEYERVYDIDEVNSEFRSWLSRQPVSGGEAAYKFIDTAGQVYRPVSMAWPNKKQAPEEYFRPLKHPTTGMECPVPERGWRNPPSTMDDLLRSKQILFGEDESKQPERKYVLVDNMEENVPSIIPFGGSDDALLADLGIPFDNPKPLSLAKDLLKYFLSEGDTFIDFFAGSATAGHASMQLCAETGLNLRFVLVQLPETLDATKKEQKLAVDFCKSIGKPLNISEISKERIRRAVNKIRAEGTDHPIDLGFKVFKLDSSNIRAWNPDAADLEKTLLDHAEHLVEGRSEQDVLYELLLKRGVDLAVPIEEREFAGKTVYSIGYGVLFACLDETIEKAEIEDLAKGITGWHNELEPAADTQVVFRDSAFADDIAKTNMTAILEQNGIAHVRSL